MSTPTTTKQKPIGICRTDGSGLWSNTATATIVTRLDIAYLDDESLISSTFGELRAYFDVASWDPNSVGLIYTDKQWILDFRRLLMKKGFSARAVEAIDYSEQGMQGNNYVSMDVGDPFIVECDKFINFVEGNKPKSIDITISALD